jgi:hypothetical protein
MAYLSLEDALYCLSNISGVFPVSVVHFLRRQKYPVKYPLADSFRGIPHPTVQNELIYLEM